MQQKHLFLSTPRSTRSLWIATAVALLAVVLWDVSGLDLPVMALFADASGFALRQHWWLERVLHDAARQVATGLYLVTLVMVIFPAGLMRRLTLNERLQAALGVTWGLMLINAIKRHSSTSCPWDLDQFGGVARYVSHWTWQVSDGGPGRCFPGGHASAAMAFLALALPFLCSPSTPHQRTGRRLLLGVLLVGLLLGLTQTLRGAHYPSHTLWTAWLCWSIALANHQLFRWLPALPRLNGLRLAAKKTPPAS